LANDIGYMDNQDS